MGARDSEGSPHRPRGRAGRAPAEAGETGRSAKYEATCRPKGGGRKGYVTEYGEPKERTRKWGGEGSQEWEGRERRHESQCCETSGAIYGTARELNCLALCAAKTVPAAAAVMPVCCVYLR